MVKFKVKNMKTLQCTKCKRLLPMDREYFYLDVKKEFGFRPLCKECRGYTFKERAVNWAEGDKLKRCSKCKRYLSLTFQFYIKNPQNKCGYNSRCRECEGSHFKEMRIPRQGFMYCITCGKELPFTSEYFVKNLRSKSGLRSKCKECENLRSKFKYLKTKDKVAERGKEYRRKNQIKINDRIRKYNNKRRATDPQFRILCVLRARVYDVIKGENKSQSTKELLGCSIEHFIAYLESKFQQGMTWDNYGRKHGQWSIDHIKPCASFDLTKVKEQRACFNWKNMKPMWSDDNNRKNSWYEGTLHRKNHI